MNAELQRIGMRSGRKTPHTKLVCCLLIEGIGPQNTCNALPSRCAVECMYCTVRKHGTHTRHLMHFSPAKGTAGLDFFFLGCNGDEGCAWGCCRKKVAADCVSASSLSLAISTAGCAWGAACVTAGSASVERSSTTGAEELQPQRGVTHASCSNQEVEQNFGSKQGTLCSGFTKARRSCSHNVLIFCAKECWMQITHWDSQSKGNQQEMNAMPVVCARAWHIRLQKVQNFWAW